jgi:hypothetical protein
VDAYLDSHGLPMTAQNLDRAYRDLLQAGKLRVSPNEPRIVPEAEKIRLARMAANGDPQTALAGYLEQRLPLTIANRITNAPDYSVVEDIINRPENQPLLREATIEVWFWSNPHTPPTPELRQWFTDYTRDMLAFNIKTLDTEVLQTGARRHVCAPVSLVAQTVFSPRIKLMNRTCPPTSPFGSHLTCPFRIMCITS